MFFYYFTISTVNNYVISSNNLVDDVYHSNETNIIYEEKNLVNEEFIVEITTELSYQVNNIIKEGECEHEN